MQKPNSPTRIKKMPITRQKTKMVITVKKTSNNSLLSKNNNNNNSYTKGRINSPRKTNRRPIIVENSNDEKSNNFCLSNNEINSSLVNSLIDEEVKEKENNKYMEQKKISPNKNNEIFPNESSFVNSDPEEIRSIFGQVGLKNENELDTSNFLENSVESSQMKTEEINESDLDPNIKEVLLLFVLNQQYYELLIQERAKKAFSIDTRKKYK